MAISKMFYKKIEYYRICRTWDRKRIEVQRYVRIGRTAKEKKQSLLEAQAIDETLKQRQISDRLLKGHNGELYFHDTGKVVGINRVFQKYSGSDRDEHKFTIRFNPKLINKKSEKPIRMSSVSIDKHGLRSAYELAVQKLAKFADIEDNKPLIKLMLESFKYYSFDPTLKKNQNKVDGRGKRDDSPPLEKRLKIDFQETAERLGIATTNKIEKNLLKELEEYQRKNPSPAQHQKRTLKKW